MTIENLLYGLAFLLALDVGYFQASDDDGKPTKVEKAIAKPEIVRVLVARRPDGRAISYFGDVHPSFFGNVVKAIGGVKQGYPIVSGLYYIKNSMVPELGPEPLIYRGSGQRAFWDWTPGDVVRADGVPTGCLLIHRKVLEAYLAEPDMTWYSLPGVPHPLPKIFEAPAQIIKDETGQVAYTAGGTSDLWFCDQVIKRKLLRPALGRGSSCCRQTGHAMMAENPDGVRDALVSFAQQVFAGVAA